MNEQVNEVAGFDKPVDAEAIRASIAQAQSAEGEANVPGIEATPEVSKEIAQ